MKLPNLILTCILAAVILAATSCQDLHSSHATPSENSIMCDKCKTTFVTIGSHTVRHEKIEGMVCPDCERAVKHFVRTGEFKHYCSHCGGNMTCGPLQ